ncbi:hypothetical protein ACFQU1_02375 [Chelatococcus sp. GCM10030263]|uniref:hypothetical protein n=1 Tax=Chelatococcus sp. GCM10030263 TaxID=3273387 RepID=UPI00361CF770
MRIITTLATGAMLALTGAAYAQAPSTQAPAPQQQAPGGAPAIQNVKVVDMEQLPEATRAEVDKVVAQRGPEQLKKLRESIDATPQIKSALEAQGLTSAQVIVASLSPEGTLTLVTKKAG